MQNKSYFFYRSPQIAKDKKAKAAITAPLLEKCSIFASKIHIF